RDRGAGVLEASGEKLGEALVSDAGIPKQDLQVLVERRATVQPGQLLLDLEGVLGSGSGARNRRRGGRPGGRRRGSCARRAGAPRNEGLSGGFEHFEQHGAVWQNRRLSYYVRPSK